MFSSVFRWLHCSLTETRTNQRRRYSTVQYNTVLPLSWISVQRRSTSTVGFIMILPVHTMQCCDLNFASTATPEIGLLAFIHRPIFSQPHEEGDSSCFNLPRLQRSSPSPGLLVMRSPEDHYRTDCATVLTNHSATLAHCPRHHVQVVKDLCFCWFRKVPLLLLSEVTTQCIPTY